MDRSALLDEICTRAEAPFEELDPLQGPRWETWRTDQVFVAAPPKPLPRPCPRVYAQRREPEIGPPSAPKPAQLSNAPAATSPLRRTLAPVILVSAFAAALLAQGAGANRTVHTQHLPLKSLASWERPFSLAGAWRRLPAIETPAVARSDLQPVAEQPLADASPSTVATLQPAVPEQPRVLMPAAPAILPNTIDDAEPWSSPAAAPPAKLAPQAEQLRAAEPTVLSLVLDAIAALPMPVALQYVAVPQVAVPHLDVQAAPAPEVRQQTPSRLALLAVGSGPRSVGATTRPGPEHALRVSAVAVVQPLRKAAPKVEVEDPPEPPKPRPKPISVPSPQPSSSNLWGPVSKSFETMNRDTP